MSDDGASTNTEASADVANLIIYTPRQMLKKGLIFAGISKRSIKKCKKSTNEQRFVSRYGSNPAVVCHIWEDLQRQADPNFAIPSNKLSLEYYLHSLHFLKRYPEEHERAAATGWHRDTCRDWGWYYVERIQALKAIKIIFPDDVFFGYDIWIMSVDGQHCWVHEPGHPEFSIDTEFYSHKYNKAGINYELGIALKESKLIWMNGPFRAGETDQVTFRNRGLREKLREMGKKAIADGGYHAQEDFDVLALPNVLDADLVKKFKRRALRRHEKFNGMVKAFNCLSGRFRHPIYRFANCFEAVCVICQYQLEHGSPLFNILVDGM